MELHRLDGLPISGLDNLDINDLELEGYDSEEIDFEEIEDDGIDLDFSGLGYVKDPELAYEILDEHGNVVMYADADENIYTVDGLGQLGFLKKIGKGLAKLTKKVKKGVKKAAKFTVRKIVKPVVKFTNRYLNPGTILLRNGFLLAMKVNMMKVAEKLRFGYLSDSEARRRGVDMNGFYKLKKAIEKAEKVYELAGGKSSNLRKAILSGKGNKDKAVPLSGFQLNGLGMADEGEYVDEFERFVAEADVESVEELLNGSMDIEGLGAVASGTALAAASSAVAAVAAVVNKITGVFDKAKKTKDDVQNVVNAGKTVFNDAKALVQPPSQPVTPYQRPLPVQRIGIERSLLPTNLQTIADRSSANRTIVPVNQSKSQALTVQSDDKPEDEKSWAEKNKILLIGTGVLVAGGGIAYAISNKNKKKATAKPLNGLPRRRKKTAPKRKKRAATTKKIAPTVML